jgi:hypothetical protein
MRKKQARRRYDSLSLHILESSSRPSDRMSRPSLSASLLLRAFRNHSPPVVRDQPQLRIWYQNQARQFEHIKTREETCANRALSSGATFTAAVVLAPSCHQLAHRAGSVAAGKMICPPLGPTTASASPFCTRAPILLTGTLSTTERQALPT